MTQSGTGQSWVAFRGRTLFDRDDQKIGRIQEIYLDEEGGHAEWALVHTGMFGTKQTFVPLRSAEVNGDDLRATVRKQDTQDAPRVDADEQLSEQEEARLFEHYGVPYTTDGSTTARGDAGTQERAGQGGADGQGREARQREDRQHEDRQHEDRPHEADDRAGHRRATGEDVSGPTTDEAMTRSEEELRVGTQTRESGRARLRKYVVTEQETHTVPVRHEEVRLEREPITDANVGAATDGPSISEEEHEVVLHEERPVVAKETVPKERVRIGTETRRDEEQVSEEVRKEVVEADGDSGSTDRGGRGTGTSGPDRP